MSAGLAGLANQIVQSLPQQLAAAFGVIHSDFGFGSFPEAANFAGYEATMSYPEVNHREEFTGSPASRSDT